MLAERASQLEESAWMVEEVGLRPITLTWFGRIHAPTHGMLVPLPQLPLLMVRTCVPSLIVTLPIRRFVPPLKFVNVAFAVVGVQVWVPVKARASKVVAAPTAVAATFVL